MHFRIQVVAVSEDGVEQLQEIADLERSADPSLETLGLTLEESKGVLHHLQQTIIDHQVGGYLEGQRACPGCGQHYQLKQGASAPFRTLFGLVSVSNPRWHQCKQCDCQPRTRKTFRPLKKLLPERTSPELLYLETKWASLAAYGVTSKLLHDVLPIDHKHSPVTVRNHTLQMARRSEGAMEAEQAMFVDGCQADRDRLPIPDGPLSVGLDGGIVRARRGTMGVKAGGTSGAKAEANTPAKMGNLFEVIAGKSILSFRRDDPETVPSTSKCFALVQSVDKKPKRRLFDLLQSQGMQANQQVTFFSDGGDNVRRLPEYLNPEADHILDWFHITMRITVLQQCARGLPKQKPPASVLATVPVATSDTIEEESLERRLESVKHYLWHGNSVMALDRLREVEEDLECWGWEWNEDDEEAEKKLQPGSASATSVARMLKYVRELDTYITNYGVPHCQDHFGAKLR